MSERGSFVTQFIYCPSCLERMEAVLCQRTKRLTGQRIASWQEGEQLPIIAGKVGGSYPNEEFDIFDFQLFTTDNAPCHPVLVAVISDTGEVRAFRVTATGDVEDAEFPT